MLASAPKADTFLRPNLGVAVISTFRSISPVALLLFSSGQSKWNQSQYNLWFSSRQQKKNKFTIIFFVFEQRFRATLFEYEVWLRTTGGKYTEKENGKEKREGKERERERDKEGKKTLDYWRYRIYDACSRVSERKKKMWRNKKKRGKKRKWSRPLAPKSRCFFFTGALSSFRSFSLSLSLSFSLQPANVEKWIGRRREARVCQRSMSVPEVVRATTVHVKMKKRKHPFVARASIPRRLIFLFVLVRTVLI